MIRLVQTKHVQFYSHLTSFERLQHSKLELYVQFSRKVINMYSQPAENR